jgi:multidrug transporter EmrE-like cation transporter
MSAVPILGAALACTAAGQLCYKLVFARSRRAYLPLAFALFVSAQVCFFLSLRVLPVGVVYMSTGITHALVLGLSHSVLGEAITRSHLLATALIIGGIVVYAG